jgi:GDP-mannose pyrophosphatase NudK
MSAPAGREGDRVRIVDEQLLSDNWYVLKKTTFDYQRNDGSWQRQSRETYDRGNGATILLYNRERKTVVLTRQFRFPAFVNGTPDGMLIETCAGLLDQDDPATCIRRETEEETGYRIADVRKVFEAYMSPGSVTERLFFFVGAYEPRDKVSAGGGEHHEGEDIEVLEPTLDEALAMVERGDIRDGKTIMLLQYAKLNGLVD